LNVDRAGNLTSPTYRATTWRSSGRRRTPARQSCQPFLLPAEWR